MFRRSSPMLASDLLLMNAESTRESLADEHSWRLRFSQCEHGLRVDDADDGPDSDQAQRITEEEKYTWQQH